MRDLRFYHYWENLDPQVENEELDRIVGVPYGCANKKMVAVMYVLDSDGEVMFNKALFYFG